MLLKKSVFIAKNRISLILIFFTLFVWLWTVFNISAWRKDNVIIHDIISYYAYLPATFVYHDLSFQFVDDLPDDFPGTIWYLTTKDGARVQKMSMGVSVLYSPFFFIAHQQARLTGYPSDGYSKPYQIWLVLSSVFYAFLALLLLRKILIRFFTDTITTITLLIIAFGTNWFFYVTNEGPMSHTYSFFLFSALIYFTVKWHSFRSISNAVALGLVGGLIVLVRPSNIIVFIIPLLYGVYNKETLIHKINLLKNNWYHLIIIVFLVCLIFYPQMLYWKKATGHWLYYSYGNEGFYFTRPNIFKGLFSYRKGWLVYTPLMLLAVAGIPLLFGKMKAFALPVTFFFIINIYIVFSWWCWWYGGSFGMRALIETYAILAIPLAMCIGYIFKQKRWVQISASVIIFLLISLNLFQTLQYRRTVIHWDSMTKEAYWAVFGTLTIPDNYQELIQVPDYDSALQGKEEKVE